MLPNERREDVSPQVVADLETNTAIRKVASTPTDQHLIPAPIIAMLYEHVDAMRDTFFAGELPPIVLSFDVRNRRNLGHYVLSRNGMGVRFNVNLNPVHLCRPVFEVLATLLHELGHAHEYEKGTGARPPHHSRAFVDMCEAFGIPTNSQGHYLGVSRNSPFEAYCRARGVPFAPEDANGDEPPRPEPLLPAPPVKPKGSKLRKWICGCQEPVPVRVARSDLDVTCNRCGQRYRPA